METKPIRLSLVVAGFMASVVLALAGSTIPALAGTTYYVRPGGSDSQAGTANTDGGAWKTIGKCASTIVAGDTCNVQAGTYNENITTLAHGGTSDSNRVTYLATGAVTLRSIVLDKPYVTFKGFEVTGCSAGGCNGNIVVRGNYVQVLNNQVHDNPNNSGSEIAAGDSNTPSYVLIQGNHIYSTLSRGDDYTMLSLDCAYCTVNNNEFGPGVDVDDIRTWGHDNVVSNNYFHDSTLSSGSVSHMDIVQTFAVNCPTCESYNFTFKNNIVKNGAQIFNLSNSSAPGMHDFYFYNNLYINTGLQGNVGIPNTRIVNNTFIDVDSNNRFTFNMLYGGDFDDTGTVVKNNIIIQTWDSLPYGENDNATHNHNFNTPDSRVTGDYNFIARRSGSSYLPISNWSEPNGINGADPKFVSYSGNNQSASNDFHLQAGSPAIDKGADLSALGFSYDKDGTSRPQGTAWDIGAYEYISGGTTSPSAPRNLRIR